MKYKVTIQRNSISLTTEEITVVADTKEEAEAKALSGDYEEFDIVECSDVAELSSVVSSIEEVAGT